MQIHKTYNQLLNRKEKKTYIYIALATRYQKKKPNIRKTHTKRTLTPTLHIKQQPTSQKFKGSLEIGDFEKNKKEKEEKKKKTFLIL